MDANAYKQTLNDGTVIFRKVSQTNDPDNNPNTTIIELVAFNPDGSRQGYETIEWDGTWPDASWTVIPNPPDFGSAVCIGGNLEAPQGTP